MRAHVWKEADKCRHLTAKSITGTSLVNCPPRTECAAPISLGWRPACEAQRNRYRGITVPRYGQRPNHEVLNFVRGQALGKLSQILAQWHRGGLSPGSQRRHRPAPEDSFHVWKEHPRRPLLRSCERCEQAPAYFFILPREGTIGSGSGSVALLSRRFSLDWRKW